LGGGQKHAFQEDSAFANVDASQLERTISSWLNNSVQQGVRQARKSGRVAKELKVSKP